MARRLNLHIDETGSQDLTEGYYAVSIIIHEHEHDVEGSIASYKERLATAGLPDIPFHGSELLHGHGEYAAVNTGDRKRLLSQYARLVRSLPVKYKVFVYTSFEVDGREALEARLRRDLVAFVFDRLSYFQSFEEIAVYYDNGQGAVSASLHAALEYALAKDVVDYREADHAARRLLQVADYACTIERVAHAFDTRTETSTQTRFFGSRRSFMQSYAKQLFRIRF